MNKTNEDIVLTGLAEATEKTVKVFRGEHDMEDVLVDEAIDKEAEAQLGGFNSVEEMEKERGAVDEYMEEMAEQQLKYAER